MRRRSALVLGCGVAALTSAQLLAVRGWRVECVMGIPPPGPVVLLSRVTAELLIELWRADQDLFGGAHRLAGRLVCWEPAHQAGAAAPSATPSLVMPVDRLLARLADRARAVGVGFIGRIRDAGAHDWVIRAGGRAAADGESVSFGSRRGLATAVKLTAHGRTSFSVIESVPGAWLFVIPQGLGCGTLQAVFAGPGGDPATVLRAHVSRSRLVSTLVEDLVGAPLEFDAAPRLAAIPCGAGWIAVGDAAMALDPLSGNGLGSGLRGAVLAAAVLDATGRDAVPQDCLDHYAHRLRDAMRGHVQTCVDLYSRSAHADGWRTEIETMAAGAHRLSMDPRAPAFRLDHGRLDRVSPEVSIGEMAHGN